MRSAVATIVVICAAGLWLSGCDSSGASDGGSGGGGAESSACYFEHRESYTCTDGDSEPGTWASECSEIEEEACGGGDFNGSTDVVDGCAFVIEFRSVQWLPKTECESKNGGSGATGSASTGAGPSTSTGPAGDVEEVACAGLAPDAQIGTSGIAFSPTAVTVPVGGIVKFSPSGTHTMTADDGSFATEAAVEACLRFNVAGSHAFSCSFHPVMTGTITVQ